MLSNEQQLLDCIADGKAVLLLGQRHTPGLIDSLVRDIAALSRNDPQHTLAEQLQALGSGSRLDSVRRAFTRQTCDDGMLTVASCPWGLVLTSAIDPAVVEAFARSGGSVGQRLRLLFPQQSRSLSISGNASSLAIVRLFGSFDEQTPDFQPPLTAASLRRRQMFDVAQVVQQLPFLAARGSLVIAGCGADDWMPLELLALACESLPTGSVHWFLGHENPADPLSLRDFGDSLVVHEGTLPEFINRSAEGADGGQLRAAKAYVLSADDHIISYGRSRQRQQIVLTPQEWRSVAQAAVVIDDVATMAPQPLRQDEEWAAFRYFLRGLHRPPDWQGILRGFLFERHISGQLAEKVEEAITNLGAVNPVTTNDVAVNYSRRPILLTGPPASGKSRLLHWLVVRLRQRGHVVVYAAPTGGRIKPEALERVCRLLEEKGAPAVALLVDDVDDEGYTQLSEALAAVGRNVVVVGTARAARPPTDPDFDPRNAPRREADYIPFEVPPQLTVDEITDFRNYLQHHGHAPDGLTAAHMRDRYFLLLLYFLLPDTRGNVRVRVADAYDRLAQALDIAARQSQYETRANASIRAQVLNAATVLFPGVDFEAPHDESKESPFAHFEETEEALDLCLFCARLRRPIPVDLLLRAFGSDFIRQYPRFSQNLGNSELLQEIIDENGNVVLSCGHSELARLALIGARPARTDQLRLIKLLVNAVHWSEDSFPGDDPNQDFCVEVLQMVGPRGEYESEYSSSECLSIIADELLRYIRTDQAVLIPKLLLLEAQAWRLLMNRDAKYDSALEYAASAVSVLEQAEDVLLARRPTDTRNTELHNVLTTRAAVHGYIIGAHLRELSHLESVADQTAESEQIRQLIDEELELVGLYVGRTRTLGRASFFPSDIDFWSLKDIFEQMPDLSDTQRIALISRMALVLDAATEEPIEPGQVKKYLSRRIQLADFEGQNAVSEAIAESMKAAGDFSGYCQLIRGRVFDPRTRRAFSASAAAEGLRTLLGLGDTVWRSREAMAFAHHLWMEAHIPNGRVGGDEPARIACSREDWHQWSRILTARQSFVEDEDNALIMFCLAWALIQINEARAGVSQLAALEANSPGSRRRVGCLAVLTDAAGAPVRYRAIARRRQGQTWICYLPELLTEIRIPPDIIAVQTDMVVGSEIDLAVGINYRGLLPWDERTSSERRARLPHVDDQRRGDPDTPRRARPTPAVMPARRPPAR